MRTIKGSIVMFFFFILPLALAKLRPGFYCKSCPGAESIVFNLVQKRFNADKSVTAALLRMHFHDCFVRGCDASILMDSTNQTQSEKEAGANQTVREFDLIDEIKQALETECPSTVSCADIITLATRDAVALAGGPNYTVPTGRRDGLRSNVNDVDLPGPQVSVPNLQKIFLAKGFASDEMVTLLGAHTVGFAHCGSFQYRLSNFQGTGVPDPTMSVTLIAKLRSICDSSSSSDPDAKTFLDQGTNFVFDNKIYSEILSGKGILQIDQELGLDRSTAPTVKKFALNSVEFQSSFVSAIVKMGSLQVLTENAGEIRQNCRAFNPPKAPTPPITNPCNCRTESETESRQRERERKQKLRP